MVNIDYSARPSELNPDFGLNIAIPSGSSFPSGHSCSSLAAATVMLIKDKRFGIPALVLALLIVFSRLYNYVHYPSDVLCGMLLGVICAVVVVLVFKKTGLDNRLSPQRLKKADFMKNYRFVGKPQKRLFSSRELMFSTSVGFMRAVVPP